MRKFVGSRILCCPGGLSWLEVLSLCGNICQQNISKLFDQSASIFMKTGPGVRVKAGVTKNLRQGERRRYKLKWPNNSPSGLVRVMRIVRVCILSITWNLDGIRGILWRASFRLLQRSFLTFLGRIAFNLWKYLCVTYLKKYWTIQRYFWWKPSF